MVSKPPKKFSSHRLSHLCDCTRSRRYGVCLTPSYYLLCALSLNLFLVLMFATALIFLCCYHLQCCAHLLLQRIVNYIYIYFCYCCYMFVLLLSVSAIDCYMLLLLPMPLPTVTDQLCNPQSPLHDIQTLLTTPASFMAITNLLWRPVVATLPTRFASSMMSLLHPLLVFKVLIANLRV